MSKGGVELAFNWTRWLIVTIFRMTSTLSGNVEQLSLGGSPWIKIHIVTTQTTSAITEQKFDKDSFPY